MSARPISEKRLLKASFERAAATYDSAASLQRLVGDRLLDQLTSLACQPLRILEVGAGTGHGSQALQRRFPGAHLVAIDLAHGMIEQTRIRLSAAGPQRGPVLLAVADVEQLPWADASFDLVFSNLVFQWCSRLAVPLGECRRVLRARGWLVFSTFGPRTLEELQHSWAAVDERLHVNPFNGVRHVMEAASEAGLSHAVAQHEILTVGYRAFDGLLRDLKAIGSQNVHPGRHPGLTARSRLSQVQRAYEALRGSEGLLPATYELIYARAQRLA